MVGITSTRYVSSNYRELAVASISRRARMWVAQASIIINTSYQKLPFGSGEYPDKLVFHQALN